MALDWRLLAFTAVVSLGTGLLFGLMPALHAARDDLSGTLRDGAGSSGGGRTNRVRSVLVVLEIALALTLVIGSGLLIRTSLALRAVAPGFDAEQRVDDADVVHGTALPDGGVGRSGDSRRGRSLARPCRASSWRARRAAFRSRADTVCRSRSSAARSRTGPSFTAAASWMTVSPGYFEVFKIPVIRGRTFTDQDTPARRPVVIINESMAKQYWKNGDPLNDHLAIGRGGMREFAAEPDRQIIGVVADSRDNGLNQDPGPKMFVPQGQIPDAVNALNTRISPMAWVIRTKVPPHVAGRGGAGSSCDRRPVCRWPTCGR